jgi:hypothetical protein
MRSSSSASIPEDLVVPIADLMKSFDLERVALPRCRLVRPDPKGPHVDREAWTVKFDPKVMTASTG